MKLFALCLSALMTVALGTPQEEPLISIRHLNETAVAEWYAENPGSNITREILENFYYEETLDDDAVTEALNVLFADVETSQDTTEILRNSLVAVKDLFAQLGGTFGDISSAMAAQLKDLDSAVEAVTEDLSALTDLGDGAEVLPKAEVLSRHRVFRPRNHRTNGGRAHLGAQTDISSLVDQAIETAGSKAGPSTLAHLIGKAIELVGKPGAVATVVGQAIETATEN